MSVTDLALSAGLRSNLLLLQSIDQKMARSQERLSTGLKINTALDSPPAYFAAKGLTNKATDLMGLKNAMGQAISTVKAGTKGIDSIQSLIDQARGLTTAAMAAMGTDSASIATRQNLAKRFDDILNAINGVTDDSGYGGKNLLKGNGYRIDPTPESKLAVNNLPGIGNARVTNMKGEDHYRIEVLGSGAVTGNPSDVANAEQGRGLAPIIVSGLQSGTQGNFNPITVEVKGPAGRDKQITVGNPPETATYAFTQDQWKTAKAAGQPLKLDHTFGSGARISFPVNFDQIEGIQPNAGQGVSAIEKHVDLQVKVTNQQDLSVVRDVNASAGNARLTNGENSFVFPSGTVRMNVDSTKLIPTKIVPPRSIDPLESPQDYVFLIDNSGSMSGVIGQIKSNIGAFAQNLINMGVDARFAFVSYSDVSYGEPIVPSVFYDDPVALSNAMQSIPILGGGDIPESGLEGLTLASDLPFRSSAAKRIIMITDATIHDASDSSSGMTALTTIGTSYMLSGKGINVDIAGPPGGDPKLGSIISSTGGRYFSVNDSNFLGGSFGILPGSTPISSGISSLSPYTELITLQVSSENPNNDLSVTFDAARTDDLTVQSQNLQVSGQGLQVDYSQNGWCDRADIEEAVKGLDTANQRLRSAAQALNTGMNVITTRDTFTKEFSDVLAEGENKLTLADQNEEGTNMLMLQTRQQLSTNSLSLATKSQQAILTLFGQ